MHALRRPEICAAFLCLLCTAVAAQGPADGALHGVVHDAGGAPIPGSTVAVQALDGVGVRSTPVARDGTFLLPHLSPGSYAVTLAAPGFPPQQLGPLPVGLGEPVELDATLQSHGAVVAAAPAEASPEGASASSTLLPDQDDDGLLSLHGLAATQNVVLLDGADTTQGYASVPAGRGTDPAPDPDGDPDSADFTTGPANGLSRGRHAGIAYIFSQSSVREFRATGQSYSAQSGHAAGGVLTTVSRSGTDHLHGSAVFVLRSDLLAAANPLSIATSYNDGLIQSGVVKPHDLRENYGAILGGPLPLRHAVFFLNFDGQRRGYPAISSPADPNFYNLTATQTALLANRGVTRAKVNTALDYLSSLTGSTPRRADQTLEFGRLDWHPRPIAEFAFEYNRVRWNSPAGLVDAPVVARARASLGDASGSLDAVILRATSAINPHVLNEFRVSFLRDLQYETPQAPLPQEPAIASGGLAPEVNIGPNGLLFGTPASLSQQAYPDEQRIQLADTLSLVRGHHLIELGGDLSFVHDRVATLANAAGTFRYDSGVTRGYAGGLVDFITDYTFNVGASPNGGCPAITAATHLFCFRSFSQSFGEQTVTFSTQEWAGFLEDTWRLRRGLTLHAGARYEYTLLPIPQAPNPALDAIFSSRGATGVFPEDRNNLGPRASVAWEPFGGGRGTVRLGYGLFFGRLPGATVRAALADTGLPSATTQIRIRPSAVIGCPQVPAQGFGYPCAFLAQPTGVVAATTTAMVFDRRFSLPAVQQGSLALERTFARHTTVSATYVMNLDRQLPSSTDLNIAPSTQRAAFQLQGGTGAAGVRDGETFFVPLYSARVTPSFGPVTDIASNVNATYHGLSLQGTARPLSTLLVSAEYTWSKAIDTGQAQSATPRTDGQFDPFTNGYDKSLSSLNYPWAFEAAAVWMPRLASGAPLLRHAANGWRLMPVVTARAGRPYSLDLSGGTYLPGGHESINGSGGALYLPTVGRNTLRLPATQKVNLRATRTFRERSRLRVEAAAEAFNLFNHQNISSVAQRAYLVGTAAGGVTPLVFQNAAAIAAEGLTTQPFGTPTAASTSLSRERQIQLSVRVQF